MVTRFSGQRVVNGQSLFLVLHSFAGLMQRIFNRNKIQDKLLLQTH